MRSASGRSLRSRSCGVTWWKTVRKRWRTDAQRAPNGVNVIVRIDTNGEALDYLVVPSAFLSKRSVVLGLKELDRLSACQMETLDAVLECLTRR